MPLMSTVRKTVSDARSSADAESPEAVAPVTRPHIAERQEARRRQILDTAGQLFYTKGYAGMTMSDLCSALGVTKPAVYYYFTDKYEIFDILCREAAQVCLSAIRETANPVLPVRERLQACLLEMARRCIACHHAAALTYRDRQYLRSETVGGCTRCRGRTTATSMRCWTGASAPACSISATRAWPRTRWAA